MKTLFVRISPVAKTLSATLQGVAGHTGSGRTFYLALKSGRKALAVDLRGVAGLRAELVREGQVVAVLGCNDGVARAFLDSADESLPVNFESGDLIQIRQNNQIILQGSVEGAGSVNASLLIVLQMMKGIATSGLAMLRPIG